MQTQIQRQHLDNEFLRDWRKKGKIWEKYTPEHFFRTEEKEII